MSTTPNTAPGRTIQSVDRTVAIINALSHESAGMSLRDLARQVNLQPQTLQSLLRTLQHHGWVVQDDRGKPYRLGPALGLINRRWMGGQDRVALAGPIVADLSRQIREYVILAEWVGGQLTPLAESQPDRELRVRGEAVAADRLHVMATGKLLLAYMDENRRADIVATMPMEPRGPQSVTDKTVLLQQLQQIRHQGFSLCLDEAARGVVAMAVPLTSPSGAFAALGVCLPMVRYSPQRQTELLDHMRQAAARIEQTWGCPQP